MAGHTVTRADLSEAVYQEVGLSRNESAELVETILNEVAERAGGRRVGQDLVVRQLRGPPEGRAHRAQPQDRRGSADPAPAGAGVPCLPRS